MLNNFIVTIGLEVHTVINTKTKMFSNAKNDHHSIENTNVSFMDLALPGILPIVNKKVVEKAIILADALKMNINYKNIQFDRKNYFYIDLPKGFQITQQYFPIGSNGIIEIINENNQIKKIDIERIHMEEDTAKQFIKDEKRFLDYNRCGSPLIEIVTRPCISSSYEAAQFLKELRRILIFKNVSDAKMEDGSMRVDINISVRPIGSDKFGTRVEIKNVNSILNVTKAIDFEVNRQISLILNNQNVEQETRRFNDVNCTTEFLRAKTNAIDYHYMTEPNILRFFMSDQEYNDIINNAPLGHNEIFNKLKSDNQLNENQILFLIDNFDYYKLFEKICLTINDQKLVFNWINTELIGYLNKNNIDFNSLDNKFITEFISLLNLLSEQEINSKQAKILFEKLFENKMSIKDWIVELKFQQIKDEKVISEIINKYIQSNSELISQYDQRPERVEKFLMGMVMKETNSQANPKITDFLIKKILKK